MANKRDYALDPSVGFDETYSIKCDKFGLSEAQEVKSDKIVSAGLGGRESTTISTALATVTPNYIHYYKIVSAVVFAINFSVDFSATNPTFQLGEIPNGSLKTGQILHCTVNTGSEPGTDYICKLTSAAPTIFTVYGTFPSGSTRNFTINGICI